MNRENERLINLGLNIKAERLRKKLSQEELAELVGTSRTSISMIETATMHSTVLKIVDIARVLGLEMVDLLRNV